MYQNWSLRLIRLLLALSIIILPMSSGWVSEKNRQILLVIIVTLIFFAYELISFILSETSLFRPTDPILLILKALRGAYKSADNSVRIYVYIWNTSEKSWRFYRGDGSFSTEFKEKKWGKDQFIVGQAQYFKDVVKANLAPEVSAKRRLHWRLSDAEVALFEQQKTMIAIPFMKDNLGEYTMVLVADSVMEWVNAPLSKNRTIEAMKNGSELIQIEMKKLLNPNG